ncbi:MAG: hypothetical protein RJA81_2124 [Planctomycetota bacterium]
MQRLRLCLLQFLEKLDEIQLVARWDVVRQARRPLLIISRFLIALIIGGQFIWLWGSEFGISQTEDQLFSNTPALIVNKLNSIFTGSIVFLSIGIIAFCPLLTVGCVAGDRERKIWYDLINSPLSGWTILLGKMVGRLAVVFGWLIAILPIWAILGLIGGLDPVKVLCGFILMIAYAWFYAAIGLLASTVTKSTRDAMAFSTAIIFTMGLVPLMIGLFMNEVLNIRGMQWLWASWLVFLPMFSAEFLKIFNSNSAGRFFVDSRLIFAFILSLGPILTLFSGLILRSASRRLDRSSKQTREDRTVSLPSENHRDAFARMDDAEGVAAIWFAPMAIKERKINSGSRLIRIFVKIVIFLILILTTYFLVYLGSRALNEMLTYGMASTNDSRREDFRIYLMIFSGLAHFALTLAISIDVAGRIVSEKESDAWLTLMSTPLDAVDILRGKAIGAVWTWRWLLLFLLFNLCIGTILGSVYLLTFFLVLLIWLIHICLALTIGIRVGIRARNYPTMLFQIVMIWGFLQILMPSFFAITISEGAIGLAPSFLAGFSLNLFADHLSGLFQTLVAGFNQLLYSVIAIFLFMIQSIQRFDKWNDRMVDEVRVVHEKNRSI